jgi:hypothetical protein
MGARSLGIRSGGLNNLTDSDPARKPIGTVRDSDHAWRDGVSVARTHLIAPYYVLPFFPLLDKERGCNSRYRPLISCHLFLFHGNLFKTFVITISLLKFIFLEKESE